MMENLLNKQQICDRIKIINENIQHACLLSNKSVKDITVMAVTKTVAPEYVNYAIECGIKTLGENKVQEYLSKYQHYNLSDADVHFIGRLQTNKVKYIADKVSMIECVDSFNLASVINKHCLKLNKVMNVLVGVNIGDEPTKSGVNAGDVLGLINEISVLSNIRVRGLFAIPPKTDSYLKSEQYFSQINNIFIDIKAKKIDNVYMDFLSMGMSADYQLAIKHGANIVRLGTAIFGKRY
ncbi:MAG TPA: YggS family pyridoxal phosphate-dependent enzyme [Ruminococcaceae bacterium]|nr:YggS family pyridoxal phosphate-dependent enzyme [Oscillospiraceae bacterium]